MQFWYKLLPYEWVNPAIKISLFHHDCRTAHFELRFWHMYAYIHLHMCACTQIYTYTSIHIYHACMHTRTCVRVYKYTRLHIHIYHTTNIHEYMYIHISYNFYFTNVSLWTHIQFWTPHACKYESYLVAVELAYISNCPQEFSSKHLYTYIYIYVYVTW